MAPPVAYVRLDDGPVGGDPPMVTAIVDPSGDSDVFGHDLLAAIAWARQRTDRVLVRVDDRSWSAGPVPVEGEALQRPADVHAVVETVDREFARHDAESRPSDEPRPWYLVILEPDADGPLDDAEATVREIDSVRRLTRTAFRDGTPMWRIDVDARCADEVQRVEGRIARALWPDERLDRAFGGGSCTFGSGEQQRIGLVEFADRCDLLRA